MRDGQGYHLFSCPVRRNFSPVQNLVEAAQQRCERHSRFGRLSVEGLVVTQQVIHPILDVLQIDSHRPSPPWRRRRWRTVKRNRVLDRRSTGIVRL